MKLIHKTLIGVGLLPIVASGLNGQPKASDGVKRMNILFIAVDDLKPILGCYGDPIVKSPNIGALSASGTTFRLNYCQQAVSGPTRASLMTGLRPDNTGVFDLATKMRDVHPDVLSLPQYLIANGYETVTVGKVYDNRCVGEGSDAVSWSVPYTTDKQLAKFYSQDYPLPIQGQYQYDKETNPKDWKPTTECLDVPYNAYKDGAVSDCAIAYLDKYSKGEKPFFLAVGFAKPHLPFVAPKKYWDLYDRESLPLAQFRQKSAGGPDIAYHDSGELQGYTDIPPLISFSDIYNAMLPIEKERELVHGYYAAVSYTDEMVGRVIDHLKAIGEYDNTIIILWGDHGWHLGDHGLWNKHTNFEQATKAPMMIRVPGNAPLVCNTPTEFVDIFPTLCDAAGVSIPANLDGVSLMPIVSGKADRVKDFSMSQWRKGAGHKIMGYALRDERYRFVVWYDNYYRMLKPYDAKNIMATEMYDLVDDPLETVNLAADPKNKKLVDAYYKKMEAFSKKEIATSIWNSKK